MNVGDRVRWNGVNRIEEGVLKQKCVDEVHWMVLLDNGKYVVVNEKSMIHE